MRIRIIHVYSSALKPFIFYRQITIELFRNGRYDALTPNCAQCKMNIFLACYNYLFFYGNFYRKLIIRRYRISRHVQFISYLKSKVRLLLKLQRNTFFLPERIVKCDIIFNNQNVHLLILFVDFLIKIKNTNRYPNHNTTAK